MTSCKRNVESETEIFDDVSKKLKLVTEMLSKERQRKVSRVVLTKQVFQYLSHFLCPLSYSQCRKGWSDFYRATREVDSKTFFFKRMEHSLSFVFTNPWTIKFFIQTLSMNPNYALCGGFLQSVLHGTFNYGDIDILCYYFSQIGNPPMNTNLQVNDVVDGFIRQIMLYEKGDLIKQSPNYYTSMEDYDLFELTLKNGKKIHFIYNKSEILLENIVKKFHFSFVRICFYGGKLKFNGYFKNVLSKNDDTDILIDSILCKGNVKIPLSLKDEEFIQIVERTFYCMKKYEQRGYTFKVAPLMNLADYRNKLKLLYVPASKLDRLCNIFTNQWTLLNIKW